MFAGDKFKPAADATYRNLFWENFHVDHSFNIGTKIQRNKEIGTIDSWGPLFRVSFDLIIHSLLQDVWSSLLAFSANEKICDHCEIALFLDNKFGTIQFQNRNSIVHVKIEVNKWFNIIIEQKSINGKVKVKLKIKSLSSIGHTLISRDIILLQLMGN